MLNITLRRKARQFSTLVRQSAITRRSGATHRPVLCGPDQMGITFIGHSSFFVQIGGRNFVIDPNFAKWLYLLKRLRRPGLRVADLPPIDAVLVTHAHFDHLHRPSLRAIARATARRCGVTPKIIVPKHVGDLVADLGYSEVIEVDWWAEDKVGDVNVIGVPANHWGARILRDMHRGFGGFALRHRDTCIYHAGDTAYFNRFREIGKRLKPDVAMLPIGAYHPASFRNVHMNPEDAVRAFVELGAGMMVPMHYGTFKLSHEPMDEPLQLLERAAHSKGVLDRVLVMEEGLTEIFDVHHSPSRTR